MKKSLKYTIPATVAVFAVTSVPLAPTVEALGDTTTAETNRSSAEELRLMALIRRGELLVNSRINTLSGLRSQFNSIPRLSAADKTALADQLNGQISDLNTLRTRLGGQTTFAAAQADINSLQPNFRIYDLVIPKLSLLRQISNTQQAITDQQAVIQALQVQLTAAENAGRNVDSLQDRLESASTRLANAQTRLNTLRSQVITLEPSDFRNNPAVIANLRSQLFTIQADIRTSQFDTQIVRVGLWFAWWF